MLNIKPISAQEAHAINGGDGHMFFVVFIYCICTVLLKDAVFGNVPSQGYLSQGIPILPITNIDGIQLCLKKRICTQPNSIFYTLIPLSKGFLGIYRHHYASVIWGLYF